MLISFSNRDLLTYNSYSRFIKELLQIWIVLQVNFYRIITYFNYNNF